MRLRKKGRKSYAVDGDDDAYFDMLENGQVE
jgi:ATP-dependent DNA helicase